MASILLIEQAWNRDAIERYGPPTPARAEGLVLLMERDARGGHAAADR
jgi:hypothetical protein